MPPPKVIVVASGDAVVLEQLIHRVGDLLGSLGEMYERGLTLEQQLGALEARAKDVVQQLQSARQALQQALNIYASTYQVPQGWNYDEASKSFKPPVRI